MISEEEYVINTFYENYIEHSNEPIAIYGIGNNTRALLECENIKKFNIVGLMDAECSGQIIYGKKVLDNDEVAIKCNIIVIVARQSVIKIIYERIRFLYEDYGIKICNIEGKELKDIFNKEVNSYENLEYWNNTQDKLIEMIDSHEVVSFDVFDTLIMRKILKPTDIFKLVELEIKKQLKMDVSFEKIRIDSERKLNNKKEAPTIVEIYNEIQKKLNISDCVRDRIRRIEYDIECKYIMPRQKIVDMYNYAISKNKKVCIISDMYYSKNEIIHMLNICDIKNIENNNVFISCEYNKTKASGKLYEYYKKINNSKSMLHVGDNIKSDIQNSSKYGIDSFYILSAYDMLVNSTYSNLLIDIKNTEEKIILGLIIARILLMPVFKQERNLLSSFNKQNFHFILLNGMKIVHSLLLNQ